MFDQRPLIENWVNAQRSADVVGTKLLNCSKLTGVRTIIECAFYAFEL